MTIEPSDTSTAARSTEARRPGRVVRRLVILMIAAAIIVGAANLGLRVSNAIKIDFGVEVAASLFLYLSIAVMMGVRRSARRLCVNLRSLVFGDLQSFGPSAALSSAYRRVLVKHWRKTVVYDYRGATAFFSAFRVLELSSRCLTLPESTRVTIIDPTAVRAIDEAAYVLGKTPTQLRNECFMTLTALHDAGHPATEVYLLAEPLGDRCEVFDDALFLTYYQGEERFDATEVFGGHTWAFAHYRNDLARSRARARRVIRFGRWATPTDPVTGDEQLTDLLAQLGCTIPLPDLRILRDSHYEALRREVGLLPDGGAGYF